MAYETMTPMLAKAADSDYAVPAFNILNHITTRAVLDTCEAERSPVILQTSVATVEQLGVREMAQFLIPMAERAAVPVAIHLDHCRKGALAKACIDAGWSSVMVDFSSLPLEENISKTRGIVEYAKGKRVSVEGELGAVGGVEDDIVVDEAGAHLANVDDSVRFVREAGVDVFAPAIGTAHGFYKRNPVIDFDLFARIKAAVGAPLVIHGGTGLAADVFGRLIRLGAAKINISSALKAAYMDGAEAYLKNNAQRDPLKMDGSIMDSVKAMAREHIGIFNSAGKA